MKFIAISDTHCRHRSLKIPKADVILHAGDITYRGDKREIIDFLDWFGKLPIPHKIFIAGNHDFFFEKTKPEVIRELLPPSVHYLKDEMISIDGIKIWGSPYTPWFFKWAFNKKRGVQLKDHWELIPEDTDILLTHGPPFGILDVVINERHTGDKDLHQRVTTISPKIHVFGHIHEAFGSVKKNGTKFINACQLNESYELVNNPIAFDLKT